MAIRWGRCDECEQHWCVVNERRGDSGIQIRITYQLPVHIILQLIKLKRYRCLLKWITSDWLEHLPRVLPSQIKAIQDDYFEINQLLVEGLSLAITQQSSLGYDVYMGFIAGRNLPKGQDFKKGYVLYYAGLSPKWS